MIAEKENGETALNTNTLDREFQLELTIEESVEELESRETPWWETAWMVWRGGW